MKYALAEYALLLKALGDPTRLQIYQMIGEKQEVCACSLLERLQITQPTLSYHLKILCECALILARKDGSWMRYRRNEERLGQLQEFLQGWGR